MPTLSVEMLTVGQQLFSRPYILPGVRSFFVYDVWNSHTKD